MVLKHHTLIFCRGGGGGGGGRNMSGVTLFLKFEVCV